MRLQMPYTSFAADLCNVTTPSDRPAPSCVFSIIFTLMRTADLALLVL